MVWCKFLVTTLQCCAVSQIKNTCGLQTQNFVSVTSLVITCSAVCSFVLYSQAVVETIPCLCISEQNNPVPVQRQFSLTHEGLGKLTPLINVWSLRVSSCHSMLHLYSACCATLVPDWAGLFSSSCVASINGCLELSCCNCPQSGSRNHLYIGGILAPEHGDLKREQLFGA